MGRQMGLRNGRILPGLRSSAVSNFVTRIRCNSNNPIARAFVARQLLFLAAFLFLLPFLFERGAAAYAPADQTTDSAPIVRPCPAPPADSKSARKEKTKRKAPVESDEGPSACLEAKASTLEIQEFFQSFGREQKWSIGKERVSEDSWTFSRSLDKDELVRFVEVGPFAGRVKWTEGKAFVKVNTSDAKDGYTRVLITARFEGYGENSDRFAPPQDTWNLVSNSTLEKNMISALETHFQSMH